jgi:hypothetical protein
MMKMNKKSARVPTSLIMNANILKSKRSMEISIILLVIATLIIASYSLFTFYGGRNRVNEKAQITGILEDLYSRESQINFYLTDIVEKIEIKDKRNPEKEFLDGFEKGIYEYNGQSGYAFSEFAQIKSQLKTGNLEISDNKIKIKLNIITSKEGDGVSAVYNYTKVFEKVLIA